MAVKAFSGGERLQAKLRELAERANKPGALNVGFLEGATYPDGTSVATVAAVDEFGAPAKNIPPRPYFRTMIAKGSPHWGEDLGAALKASDYDAPRALTIMGEEIKGELQQSIKDTDSPPLAPATVKAKGFDKPLIDSSHLINSADYEVEE